MAFVKCIQQENCDNKIENKRGLVPVVLFYS